MLRRSDNYNTTKTKASEIKGNIIALLELLYSDTHLFACLDIKKEIIFLIRKLVFTFFKIKVDP